MELLKAKATRSRVSEVFYVIMNALLPLAVFLLVRGFDPPVLAIILIFLSKWRIFALRPRFWWANIKANLVDLIVGLGVVGLLYVASSVLILQILITIAYAAWLLAIKPRSGAQGIMLQAGIAQFVGLLTLFHFSVVFPEVLVLVCSWIVGYVAARHVTSNYEEENVETLSAIWGLIIVELTWILYHWTTVYNLGLPIKIPQISLITLVVGYCAARMYHLHKHDRMTPA